MATDLIIPPYTTAFYEWYNNKKVEGWSGAGQAADYARQKDLSEYWTNNRILEVLNYYHPPIEAIPYNIRCGYLQTFSCLVYINQAQCLTCLAQNDLCDTKLPLTSFPDCWEDGPVLRRLYEQLSDNQWRFFPLIFERQRLSNTNLHPRRILPVMSRVPIHEDRPWSSKIYKIDIDESCHKLKSSDSTTPNTFVMKAYDKDRSNEYGNERKSFSALSLRHPNVVWCLGSFTQSDSSYLVLEYANRGNLYDFFRNTEPPKDSTECTHFWESMFGIFAGLDKIHNMKNNASSPGPRSHICGIHGDLKPDNILLVATQPSSSAVAPSDYSFVAKIADFGNADLHRAGEMGTHQDGNRMYSAPETNRSDGFLETGDRRIPQGMDVFALGCIFSEACVWAAGGAGALEEYFQKRRQESEQSMPDYQGCFYNAKIVLPVVTKELERLAQMKPSALHPFISNVARLTLDFMLVWNSRDRPTVQELILKLDPLRQDVTKALETVQSRTASAALLATKSNLPKTLPPATPKNGLKLSPVSSRCLSNDQPPFAAGQKRGFSFPRQLVVPESLPSRQQLPHLTTRDVLEYRREMQKPQGQRQPNAEVDNIIRHLQDRLRGRDQIFFIDNSSSMAQYKTKVEHTFEALGYIAEKIDSNELELCFSDTHGRQQEPIKGRSSADLLEQLKAHEYSKYQPALMEDSLGELVDNHIIPRLPSKIPIPLLTNKAVTWPMNAKKMNIFVFTDGDWGRDFDKASGVEAPIQRLMDAIKRQQLTRTQVTIQLVRFGKDKLGGARLKYLDDFGQEHDNHDVTDTEPYNGNVYAMFIGSIDQDTDNREPTPIDAFHPSDCSDNESSYYTAQSRMSCSRITSGLG